ncbi:DUF4837 family protein [Changchengzhania lutea]|uniref:DUF4837 family protein n=1 Tax=Changchengzhania lutea TaxID=2049305 RepID=UPI00115E5BD5|nr:DUF4837 family protein [Changchengzhania lutea]
MRRTLLLVFTVFTLISCGDGKNDRIIFDSAGKINDVSVVIDNTMWDGRVGEAIRNVLSSPIYGLPQDEPIFSINQIPSSVFDGFITKSRTILKVEMGKPAGVTYKNNVYAKPQRVVIVSGQNKDEIIQQVSDNASKIVDVFKNIEIYEKQRLIKKTLYNSKTLTEKLGLKINFHSGYRVAKEEDDFIWIRRDINTGTLNLMIYELPFDAITKTDSTVRQIIKIRDSIGKMHIAGPTEGSYMITENAYTPFHSEIILDNKPTLETKGLWDIKNAFMSGPFINYAIEDKINNRWVVVEGFAFAPSVEKRNHIFELESIIKSIKIE